MNKILSLLLAFAILISCPVFAFAEDEGDNVVENVVINLSKEDLGDNPASVIEMALRQAKDNKLINLTVNLPEGKFIMKSGLHIYSNTTLNLTDRTVMFRVFDEGSMLKTGTQNDVNSGYDGYENITVNGGVWDNNFKQVTCGMRFAHCKNIVLKNFKLRNVYDSHHIEIGAVNNMVIDGLTVYGYRRSKNTSGEAIQIDPVHAAEHFKFSQILDDTPCKNITIKNCTFRNLFAGVGSRAGVVGSYFDNIRIINNTFENITDKAICTYNYTNAVIKNNTITNANVGIFFEEFPTKNLTAKLYAPYDKNAKQSIITNTNSVISNNTIVVKRKSYYAQSCGIGIYGGVISKDTAKKTKLKSGRYLVENITVKNNKITLKSSSSCGMELKYVNNSTVKSNEIKQTVKASTDGIEFTHSTGNFINKNKIDGRFLNGLSFASSSRENSVSSNTLRDAQEYSVTVAKGSNCVIEPTNQCSGNKKGSYFIKDKTVSVKQIKGHIKVKRSKSKNTVTWSKSKNASGYYIYRAGKKNGEYKLVQTVKGKKNTSFKEKTKKKCYYKVAPYKSYSKTIIIGKKATA